MYLLAPRLYEKCAQKLEHKYLIHYSCEEKPSLSFVHREFIKTQKKAEVVSQCCQNLNKAFSMKSTQFWLKMHWKHNGTFSGGSGI